jgi:hypothetical protein
LGSGFESLAPHHPDISNRPSSSASASVAAVQATRLPCVADLDRGFDELPAQRRIDAHRTQLG